jgi:hypothetical protein
MLDRIVDGVMDCLFMVLLLVMTVLLAFVLG